MTAIPLISPALSPTRRSYPIPLSLFFPFPSSLPPALCLSLNPLLCCHEAATLKPARGLGVVSSSNGSGPIWGEARQISIVLYY